MDSQLKNSIDEELTRLEKPNWIKPIEILAQHYEGYPLDHQSHDPANAIHVILKDLNKGDSAEERFIFRVNKLDCFSYRAYYSKDNRQVYWNPLLVPFQEFSKEKTIEYQADLEYPAPDIIRNWLTSLINA